MGRCNEYQCFDSAEKICVRAVDSKIVIKVVICWLTVLNNFAVGMKSREKISLKLSVRIIISVEEVLVISYCTFSLNHCLFLCKE